MVFEDNKEHRPKYPEVNKEKWSIMMDPYPWNGGKTYSYNNRNQSYHTKLVVCDIDSHGLLTHSRLICITRGLKAATTKWDGIKIQAHLIQHSHKLDKIYLIMIRKWYNWSTNTQNQGWMDLTMCICSRVGLFWMNSCLYKILKQVLLQLNIFSTLTHLNKLVDSQNAPRYVFTN